MTAVELREKGTGHFKDGQYEEAVACYRDALAQVRRRETQDTDNATRALGQALRLNLSTCLRRLQRDPEEVITLCNEVLLGDAACAKALFQRATAGRSLAKSQKGDAARETLQAARRDAKKAATLEPQDRNIRTLLDELAEELKALPSTNFFAEGGLYDDRKASTPPPPPVVCATCGREGHAHCGKSLWIEQRAHWLNCNAADAGGEPGNFEQHGPLMRLLRESRNERGSGYRCRDSEASLSDDERETLEDCLESTERPYHPQLKRAIALGQAVQVAEELWDDD